HLTLRFKEEAWYVEDYVVNLSASSGGSPLKITHEGQGKWRIGPVGSSLTFEYDINKIVPFGYYNPEQGQISVYIDDEGGVIMAPYFFIYPDVTDVSSVIIRFNVPAGWKVVTPYIEKDGHFEVQRITNSLLIDFLHRQQIYMGKMKFYVERQVDSCTVKLGVLEVDKGLDATNYYRTQADVENAMNVTVKCLEALVDFFGENPYKVFTMYTRFSPSPTNQPYFPDDRYMGNGYAYWPEHRWDELLGHMIYAFMIADFQIFRSAPLLVKEEIMKGIGEMYYGPKRAWELFNDPVYLGKMYYCYLIYERFLQSNKTGWVEFLLYLKGPFVGLMLDSEIQKATGGTKSLDDVMKYIYSTYKNTGHTVDYHDLQSAVETVTGQDFSELFSRYVYGDEKIPYQYIQNYKPYFLDYPDRFAESFRPTAEGVFYGRTIPFFINIELMVHREEHVPMGAFIYASDRIKNFASYVLSHYTIDNLTEKNVEDALTTLAGADCSGFFTRWEDSYGRLSLGELKEWLRSYSEEVTKPAPSLQPGSDTKSPVISSLTPADGSTVDTKTLTISASYYDDVAIDVRSVELRVDGVPVTPTLVSETKVEYSATLSEGKHSVSLTVKDTSGNTATANWSFTVRAQPQQAGSRCIIATATYGSESAPQVQLLRDFRDNIVLKTFAGSSFMAVFNAWYYSWSPPVASAIEPDPLLKAITRAVLQPLLNILQTATATFSLFTFNAELGIVVVGGIISALIGLTYFAPVTAVVLIGVSKAYGRWVFPQPRYLKFLIMLWGASITLIFLGEVVQSYPLMMFATSSFVVLTIALTVGCVSLWVARVLGRV
ncbi:MAG: IPT/TIG domain-containing protein, partial [Candidatus Methanomethyliales bacterium]|nr:IPT/TIG domain-containing protein [Candidatus Methanomethylicales archaeon]